MQTLSKEAEEKIIAAVKRAVSFVDADGLEPTDAIEKVAREESWGPDMIRFASHAYNTGRQTAQRESADNALDKFAEFPLADAGSIVERLWPKEVKSAADIAYAGVSAEYTRPPAWTIGRGNREKMAQIKDASVKMGSIKTAEAQAQPAAHVTLGQAMIRSDQLKRAAVDARNHAAVTYEQMVSRMGELADYFRKDARDRLDFGYVEKAAGVYLGQDAVNLMNWVFSRNRMERFKTARAEAIQWGKHLATVDWKVEPWAGIDQCVKLARIVNEKRAAEAKAKEASDQYAISVLRPFASAPTSSSTEISWSLIPDAGADKQAMTPPMWVDGASAVKNLATGEGGGAAPEDPVSKAYEELDDPAHTAKLQQIRTQAMLADMLNDDVISGHNPETVLQNYNEMSQLTPRAANQPGVVRSQLRRQLQGNVQPFEHNEALNIEKGLKDTYRETPPELTPGIPRPKAPK